jgi:hypothetical protein
METRHSSHSRRLFFLATREGSKDDGKVRFDANRSAPQMHFEDLEEAALDRLKSSRLKYSTKHSALQLHVDPNSLTCIESGKEIDREVEKEEKSDKEYELIKREMEVSWSWNLEVM